MSSEVVCLGDCAPQPSGSRPVIDLLGNEPASTGAGTSSCVLVVDDDDDDDIAVLGYTTCAPPAAKKAKLDIPQGDQAMHLDTCGCRVPLLETRRQWLVDSGASPSGSRVTAPLLVQLATYTCPSCHAAVSVRDLLAVLDQRAGKTALQGLAWAAMAALQTRNWLSHVPVPVCSAMRELLQDTARSLSSATWAPAEWQLKCLTLDELHAVLRRVGLRVHNQKGKCMTRLCSSQQGRALMRDAACAVASMALICRARLLLRDQLPASHLLHPSAGGQTALGLDAGANPYDQDFRRTPEPAPAAKPPPQLKRASRSALAKSAYTPPHPAPQTAPAWRAARPLAPPPSTHPFGAPPLPFGSSNPFGYVPPAAGYAASAPASSQAFGVPGNFPSQPPRPHAPGFFGLTHNPTGQLPTWPPGAAVPAAQPSGAYSSPFGSVSQQPLGGPVPLPSPAASYAHPAAAGMALPRPSGMVGAPMVPRPSHGYTMSRPWMTTGQLLPLPMPPAASAQPLAALSSLGATGGHMGQVAGPFGVSGPFGSFGNFNAAQIQDPMQGFSRHKKHSNGTGYGGSTSSQDAALHMENAKARRAGIQDDIRATLHCLRAVLLHAQHPGALQCEMVACAAVQLEGGLSYVLRENLLNDSLVDMALHTALYQGVLLLVKRCAASQQLLPVLTTPAAWPAIFDDLGAPPSSAGAAAGSSCAAVAACLPVRFRRQPGRSSEAVVAQRDALRSSPERTDTEAAVDSPTVFDQLSELCRICDTYRKLAAGVADDDENDVSVLALVLEITDAAAAAKDALESCSLAAAQNDAAAGPSCSAAQPPGASAAITAPAPAAGPSGARDGLSDQQRHNNLEAELRKLRLITCKLAGEHAYAAVANQQATTSATSKSRMRAIMQEVSSLSTCLPVTWESSVHVAVDEDRLDMLRILILPGQDTPYANGAFVFDAFLPAQYPEKQPMVKFLTTGAGTVRFNPNLYQDGKVCLSLLGTWSGPSWQPGVSTFLQVLVSLQAMVFCSQPYFNEPGFEASEGTPHGTRQSQAYNAQVRRDTVTHAIVAPLTKPQGKPHAVFADVLALHWRDKRDAILKQLGDWGLSKEVSRVRRLLDAV